MGGKNDKKREKKSMPKVKRGDGKVTVSVGVTELTWDASNGSLLEYVHNGISLLKAPLEPYFWKPLNDNQEAAHFDQKTADWRECAEHRELKKLRVDKKNGCVTLTFEMSLPVGADYTLTYSVDGDGRVLVMADYNPQKDDIQLIPKFGMRMTLDGTETDAVTWYGRGPHENYPDRKRSQAIGIYHASISEFQHDYIHPQDNGYRCDVRWLSCSFASLPHRWQLTIRGLQPLCISAHDYADEELYKKPRHPQDIERDGDVHFNIDYLVHGVSGRDTWGGETLPEYTIPGNKPYHYGFILEKRLQ